MNGFREAIADCSLHDLHFSGPSSTWRGIRNGHDIRIRLDRFFATSSWTDLFPASKVTHLKPCYSDHLPILLELRSHRPRKRRKKKRFRFEEFWLKDLECKVIVEAGWSSFVGTDPVTVIMSKISNTREQLMEWNRSHFGHLKTEIDKICAQLAAFYDTSLSSPPEKDRLVLETKLHDLLHLEQDFWKQRSKVFWLTDGDLNTKFFHQQASNRRRKNSIKGLFDENGVWCNDEEDLEHIVLKYYGDMFSSSHPSCIPDVISVLPRVISAEMNGELVREVSADEVWSALKHMHPSKAPGPDGFSPRFYQHFWSLVGEDVVAAIRCFLESDDLMRNLNCTHVTLIPKVKKPKHMTHLRPISLCNVLYKIGSKVLANRLKPLLHGVISPYQSAFVPGRLISDNSLVAFEIAHFLKRRREGKVGFGALKLDMSKAYDRVEWSFLLAILQQLGFDARWISWIMRCVTTVSYSFLLNGTPSGFNFSLSFLALCGGSI